LHSGQSACFHEDAFPFSGGVTQDGNRASAKYFPNVLKEVIGSIRIHVGNTVNSSGMSGMTNGKSFG
jgi:hypothetical protein